MDFAWANAEEQGKEARDHESLNMMGVAVVERLAQGDAEAIHLGVASPVKGG